MNRSNITISGLIADSWGLYQAIEERYREAEFFKESETRILLGCARDRLKTAIDALVEASKPVKKQAKQEETYNCEFCNCELGIHSKCGCNEFLATCSCCLFSLGKLYKRCDDCKKKLKSMQKTEELKHDGYCHYCDAPLLVEKESEHALAGAFICCSQDCVDKYRACH